MPNREKDNVIKNKKINIGIGFVTGRKNFRKVVRSYLNDWKDSQTIDIKKYALHLFVAYDLKFTNTELSDYQIVDEEILDLIDSVHYLGKAAIANEASALVSKKILSVRDAKLIFGEGYAMKRNAVLYFAMLNKMDELIFLDDDEYPIANVQMGESLMWVGQSVLESHIQNIKGSDMTNGCHCGYISPIPKISFDENFTEHDFQIFIEAISNDIINWESVREKMENGGVTYADIGKIDHGVVSEVKEKNGMKFISGANLGINLKDPDKLFPFYNPPGARGEDTFLSTCIGENIITRIPCYTFHDGFSAYGSLLSGALPNELKAMKSNGGSISKRFLKASIGWVRYKPLLLYITQRAKYEDAMENIEKSLRFTIPKICKHFGNDDFYVLLEELDFFRKHVAEHYQDFENTKQAWMRIMHSMTLNKVLTTVDCNLELSESV